MDTPNRVEKRSCPLPPLSFLSNQVERTTFSFFFFSPSPHRGDLVPKRRREKEEEEDYLNKSLLWELRGCALSPIQFEPHLCFREISRSTLPTHPMAMRWVDQHALFSAGKGCLSSFCFTVRSFPGETKRNETPSTWRKIILVRDSVQWTSTPPPPPSSKQRLCK